MKTQIITDDAFFVDIIRYCEKNNISDIDDFTSKCLKSGFYVEKYGMLGEDSNLRTNTVEVVKEVEKIVEVEKEVIVEKTVIDEKQKLLQQTLQTLRGQLNLKDEQIKKLNEDIEYLKGEIDKPATFLRTSNLKDNLYK